MATVAWLNTGPNIFGHPEAIAALQAVLVLTAIETGDVRALEQRVRDGADLNVTRESDGYTPLHVAAENDAVGAINILLAAGADPNAATDKRELTLLFSAGLKGAAKAVAAVLAAGADANARASNGWTALHAAALGGSPEAIAALLGADAEETLSHGGPTLESSNYLHL